MLKKTMDILFPRAVACAAEPRFPGVPYHAGQPEVIQQQPGRMVFGVFMKNRQTK